jgi:hypothetical protein
MIRRGFRLIIGGLQPFIQKKILPKIENRFIYYLVSEVFLNVTGDCAGRRLREFNTSTKK